MYSLSIDTDRFPAVSCRMTTSLSGTKHNRKLREAIVRATHDVLSQLNDAARDLPRLTTGGIACGEYAHTMRVRLPGRGVVVVSFTLGIAGRHPDAQALIGQLIDAYVVHLHTRLRRALHDADKANR